MLIPLSPVIRKSKITQSSCEYVIICFTGGGATAVINQHVLLPNGLFDYGCPFCNTPHFKREALDLHIRCHVGQVRVIWGEGHAGGK